MTATLSPAPPRAAAPAAATVPGAVLLSPTDRIGRKPLVDWAVELMGRLETARAAGLDARNLAGEVGSIGNNAALMAAHLGRGTLAGTLCETQIEWHARRARVLGDPGLNAYAAQPWVNLGRLEVLRGQWEAAVARFGALAQYARDGELMAGCARIDSGAWAAVTPTREEFEAFLETVRVMDTFRALLLNRRWDEIMAFRAALADDTRPTLQRVGDEAAVVALARLGDPEEAHEVALSAERQTSGWHRAVFRVRRGEALLAAGQTERATGLLAQMAGVVVQLSPEVRGDLNTVYVLNRLGCTLREAGSHEHAGSVGRAMLEGARAGGDQVLEIEALRLLAGIPDDAEHARWTDELSRLEATTRYAKFRKGGPVEDLEIETLFDELLDQFAY
ncbi:hypothetical protein [Longimicrobium sp.]|uniref:hypothetical protein n=1 Tax=Longimicrobium sp. TaxID=2029185 RepID=UPI002C1DD929|nr:hypothetical protein [Longimicrobium sp.]HSU15721.1 hypothetical protein [Longimicrobium sp.]